MNGWAPGGEQYYGLAWWATPEPGTCALFGMLLGVFFVCRRKLRGGGDGGR